MKYHKDLRHQRTLKWLKGQYLVIVAYFDRCKSVNLLHLLHLWRDCQLDNEDFDEIYPYAAENLQIVVVRDDDPRTAVDILPSLDGADFIEVWCFGEVMSPLSGKY